MEETLKRPTTLRPAPASPQAARGAQLRALLGPALAGLLALAFALTRLGAPSLWMDEAFSVQLARQPLSTLLAAFTSGGEPNMIAYHLLLHGWLALGGALGLPATETFARLPSALFAAAAAAALYALGERFAGRVAALVATVIFVASGWRLTYAQEARGYAMQLALVTLGWLALLAALSARAPGRRTWTWWALFVLSMALAMYTQAFTALVLLAQGLAVAAWLAVPSPWRPRARRALPATIAAFLAIAVLIAPFVWVSRHGSKTGWLPSPDLANLSAKLVHLFGSGARAGLILGVLALVMLVAACALVWLLTPSGRQTVERAMASPLGRFAWLRRVDKGALAPSAWPAALGLALWVAVPLVVSYVISLGPTRIFSSRYLIVILPPLCLLVGMGVATLRWPAARMVALALAAVVMLALLPSYYAHAQVEDWRTPVRWLEARYQPRDGLVSYNNVQGCELPVDYYLTTDGSLARFDASSPGRITWSLYGHGDPFGAYAQALDPAALAAYAARHPRLFFIEGRFTDAVDAARAHAAQAWLDTHYRLLGQTSTGVVTIRLYDTTAAPPA